MEKLPDLDVTETMLWKYNFNIMLYVVKVES